MGTEGIAAIMTAGSRQTAEKQQPGGGQAPQIAELQNLEQTIKKMKNDYQSKARSQGVSSIEVQSKVRAFDSLIAKVDEQITQLRQASRERTVSDGRGEVSSLHYNTVATMVALRNSGESVHTVLNETTQAILQKTREAEQAARKADRMAEEEKQADSLNVLV